MQPNEQDDHTAEVVAAIVLAHAVVKRLLERSALFPARVTLDRGIGQMVGGLSRILQGKRGQLLSPLDRSNTQIFVEQFSAVFAQKFGVIFDDIIRHVKVESANVTNRIVTASGAPQKQVRTVEKLEHEVVMRQRLIEALATDVRQSMTQQLAEIPAQNLKKTVVIGELSEALEAQRWKVDRAIVTNANAAFNMSQSQAIDELAGTPEFASVFKRWTERIHDPSGVPMDDRVFPDSMVLHGQIVKPSGVFTMPADPRSPPKMVGQSWHYPPNRPRDRAIILPMLPKWAKSLPSYTFVHGNRIPFEH